MLVVVRRNYRALPTFAWYIGLNLAQALIMLGVYSHFGFSSAPSFRAYWAGEVFIMIVQTLASTEALHRALQDYPGIWELTWRVILFAILAVTVHTWRAANRTDQWGLLTAHRGYYLTFAVAFVLCLLVIRRYSVSIDPVYKMLIGGFCFYSCGSIVADTIVKSQYLQRFPRYAQVWNYSQLWVFITVLVIWIIALRHPVRVRPQAPSLSGGTNYEVIGTQVNAQLRATNDTLRKFFEKRGAEP
ncbi:MAG: hypothetical protein JO260_03065 [Acidobacteria bacterium]|nr:hypothetical protein [Acidobacteriota bacterium]